jgi:hypothetical protein
MRFLQKMMRRIIMEIERGYMPLMVAKDVKTCQYMSKPCCDMILLKVGPISSPDLSLNGDVWVILQQYMDSQGCRTSSECKGAPKNEAAQLSIQVCSLALDGRHGRVKS